MKRRSPVLSGLYSLAFASVLFIVLPGGAQEAAPPSKSLPDVISDLETMLPSLIKEARIPGLEIAVIRDGKIAWHGNFGTRSASSGTPVTDDTIFEAASFTKPFFAYYVMKLVDQGVLSLDKPVVSYVSTESLEKFLGHPLGQKGFHRDWFEKITARQVLSHSSGMPHGEQGVPFPLFFEPGTQWKYSADGYFLLQKVIETLKGDTLDRLMQREVIEPLGMSRSSMVWRDDYEQTMANGHGFFGQPEDFRKRKEAHAGASLYTTAEDYAKFVCAVLNGEGLRPETQQAMLTRQIDMDKDKGLGWSLGFGTQLDARGYAIWQWGDYGTFRNYVFAFSAEKSGIVYLTNSFYGLGISQEIVARGVGGQALGSASLKYLPYDSPVYLAGWEAAEKGAAIGGELPVLAFRYPDAFSKDGIRFLAAVFEGTDKQAAVVPLLRYYAKEHARSGEAQMRLAKALIQTGERREARESLKKAGRAREEKVDAFQVKWNLDFLRAMEKPRKLKESHLRKLAGNYGPRRVELRDGRLYYFREGGSSPDFRPLLAMSKDTFFMEALPSFRLRFMLDKNGRPIRIMGLYDDGRWDETLRDPEPPQSPTPRQSPPARFLIEALP